MAEGTEEELEQRFLGVFEQTLPRLSLRHGAIHRPPREMACRRMEWHGLSGLVVPTPTLCHEQACRAAGSNHSQGLTNEN
ncbi:hypothetical protein L3X38_011890 [Prunus dulcis]|uniref:Uncharacterized protein n=1 Tax=Prunus dulcis TaxID=3755 RepID=A0AAD4WI86_PRUDU|nr:hypothetical protein L3X38_011890 [Prunus dulcis]